LRIQYQPDQANPAFSSAKKAAEIASKDPVDPPACVINIQLWVRSPCAAGGLTGGDIQTIEQVFVVAIQSIKPESARSS